MSSTLNNHRGRRPRYMLFVGPLTCPDRALRQTLDVPWTFIGSAGDRPIAMTSRLPTIAAAFALTVAACGGSDSASSDTSAASSSPTTAATGSPDTSPAVSSPSTGDLATVDANNASADELIAALEANGVTNAEKWADEIEEYRPYATDDPTFAKLRDELSKYNPDAATLEAIVGSLTL